MALRCPICRMDIECTLIHEAPYLAPALRDNCPSQLLLPIMFIGHDSLQILDGLFPPGAVNKLTHLVMFAKIKITERRWQSTGELDNLSWKEFMVRSAEQRFLSCILHHGLTVAPLVGQPRRLAEAPLQPDTPPSRL